jgi:hypothetical protein
MDDPKELFDFFEDLASACNFELSHFEEKIIIYAKDKWGIEIEDESEFWDIFSEWVHDNIHRFHVNIAMNE